jgi:hypothetical protein
VIKKKRFNLTEDEQQEKITNRYVLIAKKEKAYVEQPWQGYCDNTDHPLFSINVTVDKPWAACYYCSKLWILKNA